VHSTSGHPHPAAQIGYQRRTSTLTQLLLPECSFDTEPDARAKFQQYKAAVHATRDKAKEVLEHIYTSSTIACFQMLATKVLELCQRWAVNLGDPRFSAVVLRPHTLQQMLVQEVQVLLVRTGVYRPAELTAQGNQQQSRHPAAEVALGRLEATGAAAAMQPGTGANIHLGAGIRGLAVSGGTESLLLPVFAKIDVC
jgi:hypothetical protein